MDKNEKGHNKYLLRIKKMEKGEVHGASEK